MPKSVDADSLTNNVYWTKHVARLNLIKLQRGFAIGKSLGTGFLMHL